MVVAQLGELLLLTPEVRISNPVVGKIYIVRLLLTVKDEYKDKRDPGMAHFLYKTHPDSICRCQIRIQLFVLTDMNPLGNCHYLGIQHLAYDFFSKTAKI